MDKLKMHSPNFTDENIAKLAAIFPGCVTESVDEDGNLQKSIDFDQLKQELSTHIVEGPQERYQLNWPGKQEALFTANAPIAKTLRPYRDESVDFDITKNLFIEGDNLDALKLLQETYLGKVKIIYIDPPYNTGKDFIYTDKFANSTEEYLLNSGQIDEEKNRLVANTDSNGRFHSDWLSMIYSRLKLARNLLKDDGVIFISIDDGEQANLKRICDEIYGEDNFIDTIAVEMSTTSGPKTVNAQQGTIVKNVEFVHIYRKSVNFDKTPHTPLFDGIDSYDTHYTVWLNDDGSLGSLAEKLLEDNVVGSEIRRYGLLNRNKFSIKNMDQLLSLSQSAKTFIDANLKKIASIDRPPVSAMGRSTPVGYWEAFEVDHRTYFLTTLSNGKLKALVPLALNYRLSDDYKPRFGRTVIRGDLWKGFHQDMGNVAKEGEVTFSNGKKPIRLIKQLIKWAHSKGDAIILDFFAGSATTAHAVMQLNSEDDGNRKFIMVQLPESCNDKLETSRYDFSNIADISKERIRRAGRKIKNESPVTTQQLDTGFRVLKVDSSNMADIYYTPDAVEQKQLNLLTDNIKADRTSEDLLFQVLLDWGVDLTLPITRETINNREVFFVDNNALVACFVKNGQVTEDFCKELTKHQPLRVVFRDSGFKDDSVKINVEQIFKLMSPHTEVKCI